MRPTWRGWRVGDESGRGSWGETAGAREGAEVIGRWEGRRKEKERVGGEEEDKAGPRRLECSEGERPQECERGSLQSHFAEPILGAAGTDTVPFHCSFTVTAGDGLTSGMAGLPTQASFISVTSGPL
jgi:hypothetical protein